MIGIVWLLWLWPPSAFAGEPALVEAEIEQRLQKRLEKILDKEQFTIVATAMVKKKRHKIILEGEENRSSEKVLRSTSQDPLPGFKPSQKKKNPLGDQQSKHKYKFVTRTQFDRVQVTLVFDPRIDGKKKAFAEQLIRDDIKNFYGKQSKLTVVSMPLVKQSGADRLQSWFANYFERRGGKGIDLLYLTAIALGSLLMFALILLWLYRKWRVPATITPEASVQRGRSDPRVAKDRFVRYLAERLVSDPLVVKNFLRGLEGKDQQQILAAVHTPAMQRMLQELCGASLSPDVGSADDEDLQKIRNDLERYIQIQRHLIEQPFGYIPMMPIAALYDGVRRFSDADCRGVWQHVGQYLEERQWEELAELFSLDEKEIFFQPQDRLAADAIEALDGHLRRKFETTQGHALTHCHPVKSLGHRLIARDRQVEALLSHLDAQGRLPMGAEFDRYRVTFTDFIEKLPADDVKSILQGVSNDLLARALSRLDLRDDVLQKRLETLLGEVRFSLVRSTMKHYRKSPDAGHQEAQWQVMLAYRTSLGGG